MPEAFPSSSDIGDPSPATPFHRPSPSPPQIQGEHSPGRSLHHTFVTIDKPVSPSIGLTLTLSVHHFRLTSSPLPLFVKPPTNRTLPTLLGCSMPPTRKRLTSGHRCPSMPTPECLHASVSLMPVLPCYPGPSMPCVPLMPPPHPCRLCPPSHRHLHACNVLLHDC